MDYNNILENLKKKIYHPVYVLMGDEPYFIDKISDYIAHNVLPEAERSFNQTILYGKDTTADTLLTVAKRFPMMAAHQVVILREAQNLKNIEDELLSYVMNPLSSTILVICYKYKSIDKRKKFYKEASKQGVVFESKKIYDNQLIPWIQNYCKSKSYQIQPPAVAMLADYLGADISKVANELDKLMILLPVNSTIAPADIEKNIGISKDFNVFELQNALGERDVLKANRIINYFGANPNQNPIQKTIATLYYYFNRLLKIHLSKDKSRDSLIRLLGIQPFFFNNYMQAAKRYTPAKVVAIISILREYDMKSKGIGNVSSSQADLQREMIYKILH
ncbi:MAG: DNA polymerase III subunit delta [Prolixibacteraceae bacterium]|jgi:DNA polymerase-3 subunit delta|nr:DNA polymerase III subunit delta [Prolixibacteraceae bacterium]